MERSLKSERRLSRLIVFAREFGQVSRDSSRHPRDKSRSVVGDCNAQSEFLKVYGASESSEAPAVALESLRAIVHLRSAHFSSLKFTQLPDELETEIYAPIFFGAQMLADFLSCYAAIGFSLCASRKS